MLRLSHGVVALILVPSLLTDPVFTPAPFLEEALALPVKVSIHKAKDKSAASLVHRVYRRRYWIPRGHTGHYVDWIYGRSKNRLVRFRLIPAHRLTLIEMSRMLRPLRQWLHAARFRDHLERLHDIFDRIVTLEIDKGALRRNFQLLATALSPSDLQFLQSMHLVLNSKGQVISFVALESNMDLMYLEVHPHYTGRGIDAELLATAFRDLWKRRQRAKDKPKGIILADTEELVHILRGLRTPYKRIREGIIWLTWTSVDSFISRQLKRVGREAHALQRARKSA